MLELAALALVAAVAWFVWDSLKAREAANAAIRPACRAAGLLFLDDTVLVEPGTRLADVLGPTTVTVRNGPHQAVGDVATELRVTARGVDGVVEAVEHRDPDTWVLGVQWHPEDTDGPADDRAALFGAFLAAVADNRGAYPRASRRKG